MKLKTGIVVSGPIPFLANYEDIDEIRLAVGNGDEVDVEIIPYPRQYRRPNIWICVDESGAYKPLPYNGWGIVGTFCVVKRDRGGRLISMKEEEMTTICEELWDRNGWSGYLHPDGGSNNPFMEPFKKFGIPPLGWCPEQRWFK